MKTLPRYAALLATMTLAFGSAVGYAADVQKKEVDIEGGGGARLKATYSSPGRPGPAMLLIHQCNMDRTAWNDLTASLVDNGVHVLAMDLRGFGESPGAPLDSREAFGELMQKSPADVDAALAFLVSQDGVDGSRVGVGGASCGAMLTADLASRHEGVVALMLLSGPPSEEAIAHIGATPGLAVLGAATKGDTVTPGVADSIQRAAASSKHPASQAKIYEGTEHGLPMFAKNQELEPFLVSWLTEQLGR